MQYPRFANDHAVLDSVQIQIGQAVDGNNGIIEPSVPHDRTRLAVNTS